MNSTTSISTTTPVLSQETVTQLLACSNSFRDYIICQGINPYEYFTAMFLCAIAGIVGVWYSYRKIQEISKNRTFRFWFGEALFGAVGGVFAGFLIAETLLTTEKAGFLTWIICMMCGFAIMAFFTRMIETSILVIDAFFDLIDRVVVAVLQAETLKDRGELTPPAPKVVEEKPVPQVENKPVVETPKPVIQNAPVVTNQLSFDISALTGNVPEIVIKALPTLASKFGINTPTRLAHFLGQIAHESNFRAVAENLNYDANGLLRIFPRYFPTLEIANQFARQPEKIANVAYANRMGNGDTASGEGWKFRGRGLVQLTGKNNYKAFSDAIGEDCVANPDLLLTKYPVESAGWFWSTNRLNEIADTGSIEAVTRKINGGLNNLAHRVQKTNEFKSLLKVV